MRKLFLTLIASALCTSVFAVPAIKDKIVKVQPDGSRIEVFLRGDEYGHWYTDLSGNLLEEDVNGFLRPSTRKLSDIQAGARTNRMAANAARRGSISRRYDPAMTLGERHILVVLVNFSDVKFTVDEPQTAFSVLLNERGYSRDGGTGSVKDYYEDNSGGQFRPVFDVYGPVTLSEKMAYYGGNTGSGGDRRPEIALYHACKKLDETVDFSDYDTDSDGYVDMILFYYAGYNEAEGGSSNSIWPHSWDVRYSGDKDARDARFDGIGLGNYFCTSEYKYGSGQNMCGIGTTCHEFAHSLGLPDFYDTNYGTDGEAGALYSFSIMCSGPYNNNSRTPPHFNIIERQMLGWVPDFPEIDQTMSYSLHGIQYNEAFYIKTPTEGETFILECRDGSAWDSPLPEGMLIYHMDRSQRMFKVAGYTDVSASDLWEYWDSFNNLNAWGNHPLFYVVPAADPGNLKYNGSHSDMMFPGSYNVTEYSPVDWDGNPTDVSFSNIVYAGGEATFNALSQSSPDPAGNTFLMDMGVCYISQSKGQFTLTCPESVSLSGISWFIDGDAYEEGSLTVTPGLPAGIHEVSVSFTHSDGRKETIEITVTAA